MASTEQIRFHGAMMRHLRNCLKTGAIDDRPDTAKALQYARRLVDDAALRKNIADGLTGNFSIDTDMKYIHKLISLSEAQEKGSAAPGHCGSPSDEGYSKWQEEELDLEEFQKQCSPEEWAEMMRPVQEENAKEDLVDDIPF
jgi:hypothetical protein